MFFIEAIALGGCFSDAFSLGVYFDANLFEWDFVGFINRGRTADSDDSK